ncbi:PqqD family peptide modification chaperone [Streptomyces sp. TS71-3]|uniref:PqqD family peptide modification chaperone n=1 Tax=Streptomyces sp. TS71-3 TaxID=2733862 RepID=UPI001B0B763E|nr:PqqD family peptide modification chaperone [Streptomyces sp. TS71-3]GHJ35130.1 hypothetical protein Sm713_07390 [Streptomyces sp. TS71-3]
MLHVRDGAHPVLTDEGGALLDERTGRWTYLTPTASAVMMLLLSCTTRQEAAARLAERYDIPGERAAADIRTIAATLTAQGLAHGSTDPAPRRRWWNARRP